VKSNPYRATPVQTRAVFFFYNNLPNLRNFGTNSAVNLPKVLAELKRRNVYKVAIAYGVVAWLLMQVASQIFPFLFQIGQCGLLCSC
jgi:hypothetical protein